jgi:hypothetical protein
MFLRDVDNYQTRLCHNPEDHNMNPLEFLYKHILLGLYISWNTGLSEFRDFWTIGKVKEQDVSEYGEQETHTCSNKRRLVE